MNAAAPLRADRIAPRLHHPVLSVSVRDRIASTNDWLARHGAHGQALVAGCQTAGRGRRGKPWLSPAGGLYYSLAWQFANRPRDPGTLSLLAGLSAAACLEAQLDLAVRVKWPNDLLLDDRKLGGCLVEMTGADRVIMGTGINLALPADCAPDQPWTDLAAHGADPDRNWLAAALLEALARDLDRYGREGFGAFDESWQKLDAIADRKIFILRPGEAPAAARARGIDGQGRLCVESGGERRRLVSGEVSIRVE